MAKDKKPSEVIQGFLDYLKSCQEEYETAKNQVWEEEAKHQDFWHLLEFDMDSKSRAKTATAIHESRIRRRKAKNQMELLENVVQFSRNERTKMFIQSAKTLIRQQMMEEERLENDKEYKPRTYVWSELKKDGDKGNGNS